MRKYSEKSEMYDWITASYVYSKESSNPNDFVPRQRYVQRIIQTNEVKNFYTNTVWSNGYLYNNETGRKMRVNISDNRINIGICPNKWVLGNNVQEAPLGEVKRTFEYISERLGLDLMEFVVTDLDVTHTAQTEYIPQAYFPYLCLNDGFERWQQNTSLYYGARSSKIVKLFYDKVNQVNGRINKTWGGRQSIPFELKGQNLTRFECRLGTNMEIRNVIGGLGNLGQLFQEEHIEQLQDWWLNQYEIIPKTTELNWKFEENMGQKAVDETINHLGLMSLGRLQIEQLIELASKQGAYKYPSQKTASKKKLLGAFEANGRKHELIKELDEKYRNTEPKW